MVYVYIAEGFEEVEALTIVDILRRANIEVETVSITGESFVVGTHGIKIETDIIYEETDHESCEMIVLPGGLPGADYLAEHEGLANHIKCFSDNDDKKLAAICAAPQVFGKCGILNGRKATIYPGMEDYLNGGEPTDENVSVDGNIITGMGPALAMEFALRLVEEIKGKSVADDVAEGLLYFRR